MIILDPETDERTVASSLEKLLQVVPSNGDTVDKIDIWGKRVSIMLAGQQGWG